MKERLVELLRELSVKTGHFVLASGRESDLYVDARQTTLNAEGASLVGRLVADRLHPDVVAVGGMTMGADPIATAASLAASTAGKPVHAFLIRKNLKDHGTGRWVEGRASVPDGAKVCIVEDTTTTGGSLLAAVERAEAAGLQVVQTLTVVDREEGAAARLGDAGYTLEALVTRTELLA